MKWRFGWVYRLGLAILLVIAFWSVWARRRSNYECAGGERVRRLATNRLQMALVKLNEHVLTFGLDRVGFLRDNFFLDQPLWKYGASLIYVLLAFVVAMLAGLDHQCLAETLDERTETKMTTCCWNCCAGR